jgi:hypothetical protein
MHSKKKARARLPRQSSHGLLLVAAHGAAVNSALLLPT